MLKQFMQSGSLLAMAAHAPGDRPSAAAIESAGMDLIRDVGLHPDDAGDSFDDVDTEDGDTGLDNGQQQQDFGEDDGDQGDDGYSDPDDIDIDAPPQQRRQQQERQQQRQPMQQRNDLRRRGPLPRMDFSQPLTKDQKGNILLNGQVVAKAGAEAAVYENVHKQAQGAINHLHREARGMLNSAERKYKRAAEIGLKIHNDYKALEQEMGAIRQLGLNNTELLQAATMAKRAQSEPLAVLKELLTMAVARGIDVSSLGVPGGAIDPKALSSVMQGEFQKLAEPITQFTKQQQERERLEAERAQAWNTAQEITTEFFGRNRAARPFAPMFKAVLDEYPDMPLPEIWDKLQLHLMRRGIDPHNRKQVERLLNGGGLRGQQQRPNGQQPPRNWVPPRGGRRPPVETQQRGTNLAPVSKSYESIIRDLLNEK